MIYFLFGKVNFLVDLRSRSCQSWSLVRSAHWPVWVVLHIIWFGSSYEHIGVLFDLLAQCGRKLLTKSYYKNKRPMWRHTWCHFKSSLQQYWSELCYRHVTTRLCMVRSDYIVFKAKWIVSIFSHWLIMLRSRDWHELILYEWTIWDIQSASLLGTGTFWKLHIPQAKIVALAALRFHDTSRVC